LIPAESGRSNCSPSLEVIKAALEVLSHQYPQTKETDADLIMETSVMRRIEQSGFIKALYKKSVNPRSSALARRILRLFHILCEGVLGRKTDRAVRVNSLTRIRHDDNRKG
jgi:hypothetical protein